MSVGCATGVIPVSKPKEQQQVYWKPYLILRAPDMEILEEQINTAAGWGYVLVPNTLQRFCSEFFMEVSIIMHLLGFGENDQTEVYYEQQTKAERSKAKQDSVEEGAGISGTIQRPGHKKRPEKYAGRFTKPRENNRIYRGYGTPRIQ